MQEEISQAKDFVCQERGFVVDTQVDEEMIEWVPDMGHTHTRDIAYYKTIDLY